MQKCRNAKNTKNTKNTKHKTQNTKHKTQNTKHKTQYIIYVKFNEVIINSNGIHLLNIPIGTSIP